MGPHQLLGSQWQESGVCTKPLITNKVPVAEQRWLSAEERWLSAAEQTMHTQGNSAAGHGAAHAA